MKEHDLAKHCCSEEAIILSHDQQSKTLKDPYFNRDKNLFLYLYMYKNTTSHFQYKLMEHLEIFDLI